MVGGLNIKFKKDLNLIIIAIGLFGSLASIFFTNDKLYIYIFLIIMVSLISFTLIKNIKKNQLTMKLFFSRHPGWFASQDLKKINENENIEVSRYVKNIKYSDNNRTSNVTIIINGKIIEKFCLGLFLPISAASLTSNIKKLSYSLILDEKNMIAEDNFHSMDDINKLLKFDMNYKEIENTPYAKKLYLPFTTCLENGDKFQVILYYTWENSIIDQTDSTSYYVNIFSGGIKKLVTHLVFTTTPSEVIVYKIMKNKKRIISKVKNIKKDNDLFFVRWEIDDPKDNYILQRTLDKW